MHFALLDILHPVKCLHFGNSAVSGTGNGANKISTIATLETKR